MTDEAQDKQHAATGKRLDELRRKGTVLRSKDLSGGLIFISAILILLYMSGQFMTTIKSNFVLSFGSIQYVLSNPSYFNILINQIVHNNFKLLLPIFLVTFAVAFLSPFLFGGWNFTLDVLQFKLEKLNPMDNLKRLFSIGHTSIEIARSIIKAALILSILVTFIIFNKNNIISLSHLPDKMAIFSSWVIIKKYIFVLSIGLIATVALDLAYHFLQFQKKTKMSTQEIKDESKDAEGNVHVKRKIRTTQIALLKQRLYQSVPKATVVITNPTHFAVAIKYDNDRDSAPKLLAKGKGPIAAQIRQIAIMNGIPMYEAPELARAIYYTTRLNAEINPGLYMAVAIVLSYVYQLKNYQMGVLDNPPTRASDLKVPDEFIYDE
jgi:flagellar biosynthetic protein FlhB